MSAASARRTIARLREQIDHAHGKWLGVYNAKRIAEVAHQHHVGRDCSERSGVSDIRSLQLPQPGVVLLELRGGARHLGVQPLKDAIDFLADGDPFDRFPWTVTLYSTEFQDLPEGHRKAFISTANGKRIDNGEQHTYWSVAGDLWEPTAVVIAKCVNAEAARRYGTPNPPSVYVDEWRQSLEANHA